MSIYTATNCDLTINPDLRELLTHSAIDTIDQTGRAYINYEPSEGYLHRWLRDNSETNNFLTWNSTLDTEQIAFLFKTGTNTASPIFRRKSNQFHLEQDDSESEVETDEALPEFLDTFEVKEGD